MDIQVESGSRTRKGCIPRLNRALGRRYLGCVVVLLFLATGHFRLFGQSPMPLNRRQAAAQNPAHYQAQTQDQNQDIIPTVLTMQIKDGKVSASVRAAPLQKVLEELAAHSGIVFEVQSQDNPLISIALQEVSLQEAIQRIASADDLIFYHGRDSSGRGAIQLVKAYPRAEVPLQPSIRYIGRGVITKTGEDSGEGSE